MLPPAAAGLLLALAVLLVAGAADAENNCNSVQIGYLTYKSVNREEPAQGVNNIDRIGPDQYIVGMKQDLKYVDQLDPAQYAENEKRTSTYVGGVDLDQYAYKNKQNIKYDERVYTDEYPDDDACPSEYGDDYVVVGETIRVCNHNLNGEPPEITQANPLKYGCHDGCPLGVYTEVVQFCALRDDQA